MNEAKEKTARGLNLDLATTSNLLAAGTEDGPPEKPLPRRFSRGIKSSRVLRQVMFQGNLRENLQIFFYINKFCKNQKFEFKPIIIKHK